MQNYIAIKSNHQLLQIENMLISLFTAKNIDFIYRENILKSGKTVNFLLIKVKKELPYEDIAKILSHWILSDFETELISDIFNNQFLGFSEYEKSVIINKVLEKTEFLNNFFDFKSIVKKITNCLQNTDILSVEGILRFCIKEYRYKLKFLICDAIEEYNAEQEYNIFLQMLTEFVEYGKSTVSLMHILVNPDGSFSFYDFAQKEIILEAYNIKSIKEIFTDEDIVISVLLATIPKRIIWHINLEFKYENLINTIKEIFKDKFSFCYGCKLCNPQK